MVSPELMRVFPMLDLMMHDIELGDHPDRLPLPPMATVAALLEALEMLRVKMAGRSPFELNDYMLDAQGSEVGYYHRTGASDYNSAHLRVSKDMKIFVTVDSRSQWFYLYNLEKAVFAFFTALEKLDRRP